MRDFLGNLEADNDDISNWAERRFYIPSLSLPGNPKTIHMYPHQRAVLSLAFKRKPNGDLPYRTLVYCLAPETKVLTRDLRWVQVGSLVAGDQLVGFDEKQKYYGPGNNRQWTDSEVTATGRIRTKRRKLTFSDGSSVVASLEHPWLVRWRNGEKSRNIEWRLTANIRVGDTFPKYLETWAESTSWAGGYLAAALDGEASLSLDYGTISFVQNDNAMLSQVVSILEDEDIKYRTYHYPKRSDVVEVCIKKRAQNWYVLGKFRPQRLLAKWRPSGSMLAKNDVTVVSIEEDEGEVVTLETSTATYVAEGFAAHNSTIKQSGKSTVGGIIGRWYAETQRRFSEIYYVGNDQEQAKSRGFREIRYSLELDPNYDRRRDRIPGEWQVAKTSMTCTRTGTVIRALPVDARGEAGGKPSIQVWTELWGVENEDGRRFWDELTPIPTIPDSVRVVETYAGYVNESELLYDVWVEGTTNARQLTAGEVAARTGAPVSAWHEAADPETGASTPEALIPVWENVASSMLTYWDSGDAARRMPWQLGERGQAYYQEQERTLVPAAFDRLHRNLWSNAETAFVQEAHWDACLAPEYVDSEGYPIMLPPGDRTPLVLGVDAATTGDCFAIVAVSRYEKAHDEIAVRAVQVFDPKDSGGVVSYERAEDFIRYVCEGGCWGDARGDHHPKSNPNAGCESCTALLAGRVEPVPGYNVVEITYDPFQLESVMQRMRRDGVGWCKPFSQGQDRLKSDRGLYDLILTRRLHHNGDRRLRAHILNAGARLQKDADSTLRLIKVRPNGKIDATVALSMAAAECMRLNI